MSFLISGTADALARKMTPAPERPPMRDPVEFSRDRLSIGLWSIQREIIRTLFRTDAEAPRRLGVPSCHGTGKSELASIAATAWIEGAPLGTRKIVSSAPTGDQVSGILWEKIKRHHTHAGLPGNITGLTSGVPKWHVGGELVGWGRKPADLADPNQARQAFQGIHAPNGVLVILDEATGIPPWLWEAGLSLLTNASSRILAIGNPDDPSCTFAEKCQPGSGWWVKHISAFDTPLFTGEPVSQAARDGLISPEWVRDAEQDYGGTDNPLYQSKVLGQFPDKSDTLVISPHLIKRAQLLDLPGRARGAYGLDVSRSKTGDETTLYRARGGVMRLVDSWRGLPITANIEESDSTVARTYRHIKPNPAVPIVVDGDGMGIGAVDGLRALRDPAVLVASFSSAGPPRRPDRFDTRRSEIWWGAREALELGLWDLDPADELLAAQLLSPRWWVDGRGRIHVETKKELSKRGVKSPDRADGVIMADQGEPMDLSVHGELGARVPQYLPGQKRPGVVPESLRVRPGESVRSRAM